MTHGRWSQRYLLSRVKLAILKSHDLVALLEVVPGADQLNVLLGRRCPTFRLWQYVIEVELVFCAAFHTAPSVPLPDS